MNFHTSILQAASMIKNNETNTPDDDKKKRERSANFTEDEINRLVDLVLSERFVIENKKNGVVYWNAKNHAWKNIEQQFNMRTANDSIYRDSKTLRIKYEGIKREIKKKWADILAGKKNALGRLPTFSAAEKKIKDILQLPIVEGFCDFSNMDEKSEDEDYVESLPSSPSGSTKEQESITKKDAAPSVDDDDAPIETCNVEVEIDHLNEDEPPVKKICSDPLVVKDPGKDSLDHKIKLEKLRSAHLQNVHLRQEIKLQSLKMRIMEEELQRKKIIHDLEIKQVQLKINALKNSSFPWDNDYSD